MDAYSLAILDRRRQIERLLLTKPVDMLAVQELQAANDRDRKHLIQITAGHIIATANTRAAAAPQRFTRSLPF